MIKMTGLKKLAWNQENIGTNTDDIIIDWNFFSVNCVDLGPGKVLKFLNRTSVATLKLKIIPYNLKKGTVRNFLFNTLFYTKSTEFFVSYWYRFDRL